MQVSKALCVNITSMNNRYDIEFVKYEFAKYSFMECSNFLDLYEKMCELSPSKLSFGTMVATAFVVTYARPFSGSNKEYHGFKMGGISDKWLNDLSDDHKKSHEYLLGTGRNALAAHIDLGKLMPNVFVKDGPHNDYVFDRQLPVINANTLEHYKELVGAAFIFCQKHQDILKPNLSSDHLVPEAKHPDAKSFIKRSTKNSEK